jgi:predicted transcriptional regulator
MVSDESGFPPLSELRRRRRAFGASQTALARAAGVSQSLLAKIERTQVEPSYRKVLALFRALDELERMRRPDVTVGELSTRPLVRVGPSSLLTAAAHLLRRHAISQVPVMEDDLVVGSLTDRTIVECLADPARAHRLARLRVAEVMGDPFPQLDRSSSSQLAAVLLGRVPAVLVTERGRPAGIVTQSDLFKSI